MEKILWRLKQAPWYLKQLLPLTHRTTFERAGKKYFTVWRMWFGVSFDIEEMEIVSKGGL